MPDNPTEGPVGIRKHGMFGVTGLAQVLVAAADMARLGAGLGLGGLWLTGGLGREHFIAGFWLTMRKA